MQWTNRAAREFSKKSLAWKISELILREFWRSDCSWNFIGRSERGLSQLSCGVSFAVRDQRFAFLGVPRSDCSKRKDWKALMKAQRGNPNDAPGLRDLSNSF